MQGEDSERKVAGDIAGIAAGGALEGIARYLVVLWRGARDWGMYGIAGDIADFVAGIFAGGIAKDMERGSVPQCQGRVE